MSDKIAPIYAPSLYGFAYEYHRGLVTSNDDTPAATLDHINPQWVQAKYSSILKQFEVDLELDIRSDEPSQNFDLLVGVEDERTIEFFTTNQHLEGFIYPQSLHDSYALNLNIYQPETPGQDEYKLADLAQFNPGNCFQPEPESASNLGQTLLLSAYLNTNKPENIRDLEPLARQGRIKFFHLENWQTLPPLYRAYNLLGGYLYEYGSLRGNLEENSYGHLLTWFLFEEQPTLTLQKCYGELPELLLYYHKIRKSFQDSRIYDDRADRIVAENEAQLNQLHQNYLNREKTETLSTAELATLTITLKTLLATSLNSSQKLRNMEYARHTIAINSQNYQTSLEPMEQLAETPREGWRLFYDKEAITFQKQIRAYLNYFNPGSNLLNQAIATIRGLVEVDQAESDRHIQEKQQKLQDHIQAVGVGIAGGAIVASSSGLLFEPQPMTFPWPAEFGRYPHPFLSAFAQRVRRTYRHQ